MLGGGRENPEEQELCLRSIRQKYYKQMWQWKEMTNICALFSQFFQILQYTELTYINCWGPWVKCKLQSDPCPGKMESTEKIYWNDNSGIEQ